MEDSLSLCASAFVRNKGKNVFTENDILMGLSMDLRWMSYSDAKIFFAAMLAEGIFEKSGDKFRASPEIVTSDVPVAYKPGKVLIEDVKNSAGKPAPKSKTEEITQEKEPVPEQEAPKDYMPTLLKIAVENGIERRDFMMKCNAIVKKMGIFIEAAALFVLRDAGVDVSELADQVYESVKFK